MMMEHLIRAPKETVSTLTRNIHCLAGGAWRFTTRI
jgi:hypothetical protein